MCRGKEQGPRLRSVFLDSIHLTMSTLFIPTHFWRRLYPSSLCTTKMFSLLTKNFKKLMMKLSLIKIQFNCKSFTFGICERRPSKRWAVTFGFALNASNTVRILTLVCSEQPLWFPADKSALPDWKKWLTVPPILLLSNTFTILKKQTYINCTSQQNY